MSWSSAASPTNADAVAHATTRSDIAPSERCRDGAAENPEIEERKEGPATHLREICNPGPATSHPRGGIYLCERRAESGHWRAVILGEAVPISVELGTV
jgi:hypothetical protein